MFAKEHEDEENKFDICIKVHYFVFFCILCKYMYTNRCHFLHTVHKPMMCECWQPASVEHKEQYWVLTCNKPVLFTI